MPRRYLNKFLIGIEFMEIRPDGRIALIDFAAPHISRTFGIENTLIRLGMYDLFVRQLFIEGLPVEKNLADVVNTSVIVEPVAAQQLLVRIIIAENVFGITTFQTPSSVFVQPVTISEPLISTFSPGAAR